MHPSRLTAFLRCLLGLFFVVAGANHFRSPETYLGMIPGWLPAPAAMNVISGAAEMAGGIGLLVPGLRRWAAWGLIALLVAVFPANLHVALQGHMPGFTFSPAVLWLRLPFQALFIAAVWAVGLRHTSPGPSPQ
jgi:uncharacterized membrane protein